MNQYGFYDYYDSVPYMPDAQITAGNEIGAAFGVLLGVFMVIYIVMMAICIGFYVLQSLGIYTIAKRRGIHNPWLAWLPIGNMWMLGSISDQYQYVKQGKVTNRRKVILILYVVTLAASVLSTVGAVAAIVNAAMSNGGEVAIGVGGMLLSSLLLTGVAIAAMVMEYIILYDVYRSCDPDNSVAFLVLSIFIPVTMPFFLFFNRKKDKGMPPRRQPAPEQLPEEKTQTVDTEVVVEAEAVPVQEQVPVQEEAPVQEAPAQEEPTEE